MTFDTFSFYDLKKKTKIKVELGAHERTRQSEVLLTPSLVSFLFTLRPHIGWHGEQTYGQGYLTIMSTSFGRDGGSERCQKEKKRKKEARGPVGPGEGAKYQVGR